MDDYPVLASCVFLGAGAIYARVSTDEQDESLQLTPLRDLVSQRGWELKGEYVDHGISSRGVRPELERMMRDAHKRRFDVVAVWKFDRFARSTRELVFALEQFQALGIDFVSVTQSIDTSGPMGKLVFSVLAAIAEFERELIRERVVAGMKEAQRRGKHCGRPVKEFEVEGAAALQKGGLSWRKLARATGVPVHLLRTRLASMQNGGCKEGVATARNGGCPVNTIQ
jgi:DNA invertase Pin-like site-specific DNA recombinase